MIAVLAASCIVLGTASLYVAAPHQKLLARHRGRAAAIIGTAMLAAALLLLLTVMGPATAVFTWMTGATLIWTIVPLAAAWWRGVPEGKR